MAENGIVVSQPQVSGLNMFANQESFNTGYKMAQILSSSTIIPDSFKGNIGNVMIAIDIAQRLHTNPLMIMQNMSVIYGMPSFSRDWVVNGEKVATYVIAEKDPSYTLPIPEQVLEKNKNLEQNTLANPR